MPLYRFHIDAPVNGATALARVAAITRDVPSFRTTIKESLEVTRSDGKPFIGKVEGNAFLVRRHIQQRNSFVPRIHGTAIDTPVGSRVTITMYFHPIVAAFMVIWLVVVGAIASAALSEEPQSPASLVPIGMLAVGVVLLLVALVTFLSEARKARQLLQQAIRGVPA